MSKYKICENCGNEFPIRCLINGELKVLYRRKFCLNCSPFGLRNTVNLTKGKSYSSKIRAIPINEFKELVKISCNRNDIFRKLGMRSSGASHKLLNSRLDEENIDISHFKRMDNGNSGKIQTKDILCENSNYLNTVSIKRRLIEENIMKYECVECGNIGTHNNKKLNLQLDHINGVRNDNRLENLRFLCPNCHSQTDTFCRGNRRNKSLKED